MRTESTPHWFISSTGSIPLPSDLENFLPSRSLNIPWKNIVLKGISSVKYLEIIIILAIHKYLISGALISKSQGKYRSSSSALSGNPRVEIGQSPEENQVSRTCSSCTQPSPGESSDNLISFPRYQTGILCPHQRLREIHQS